MNPDDKEEKKTAISGRWKKAALTVLIVLAVLALALVIAYRSLVVKPELPPVVKPPVTTIDPETGETVPVEDPTGGEEEPASGRKSKDFYTILVFGSDKASGLTDTMMVVSYDVTNQTATVMSLPRDTLVNVDRGYKKLNGIYSWRGGGQEGIAALKYEVSRLIGFTPDYYVQINWELVGLMVDALGGVEYDVPFHMEYDDPAQDLHIYVEKGLQVLDGDKAMQVVRWRKNNAGVAGGGGGSDLNRIKVQQGFLQAVLKQALQLTNVTKINQLSDLFSENVISDLSIENMFWFASQAIMGGLKVENVQFCTMPYAYGVDYKHVDYVYPDQGKLLTLINERLNPFLEDVTLEQLDLMTVNKDGTMSSSTGVLADPDMGVLPPQESEAPAPETSGSPDSAGGSDSGNP